MPWWTRQWLSDLLWLMRCGRNDMCHRQADALGVSTSVMAPAWRQHGKKPPPNSGGHVLWARKKPLWLSGAESHRVICFCGITWPILTTVTEIKNIKISKEAGIVTRQHSGETRPWTHPCLWLGWAQSCCWWSCVRWAVLGTKPT